jgi:transcriptional repressor NrdR
MKCPVCHQPDSRVTDTRVVTDGFAIRRRRECARCSARFSTYEEVELLNLTVLKRDGSREPYLREKLEQGLRKATEKRPITAEEFRRLISRIEGDIQKKGARTLAQGPRSLRRRPGRTLEIKARDIGEIVMRQIRQVDPVAYIRFASVYRSFQDAESFQRELRHFLQTARTPRRQVPSRPSSRRSRPAAVPARLHHVQNRRLNRR